MSSANSRITLAIAFALGFGVTAEVASVSPLGLVQFEQKVVPVSDSSNSEKTAAEKAIPASDSSNSEKTAAEKIGSEKTKRKEAYKAYKAEKARRKASRSEKTAAEKEAALAAWMKKNNLNSSSGTYNAERRSEGGTGFWFDGSVLVRAEEVECGGPYMCKSQEEAWMACSKRMHQFDQMWRPRWDILDGVGDVIEETFDLQSEPIETTVELCPLLVNPWAEKVEYFRNPAEPYATDKHMVFPTVMQMALGNTCSPMWTDDDGNLEQGCFYNTGSPECGGIERAFNKSGNEFYQYPVIPDGAGSFTKGTNGTQVWANRLFCYGDELVVDEFEAGYIHALPSDGYGYTDAAPVAPVWQAHDGTPYWGFNAACCVWMEAETWTAAGDPFEDAEEDPF